MDKRDFDTWIRYHCDAFGSLREWLAKQGKETLEHWARALESVDLRDARKATDRMFSGEGERPEGWSAHPAAIRRIVSDVRTERVAARRMIEGQEVYKCNDCQDFGTIRVFSPKAMKAMKLDAFDECKHPTCSVACKCPAGDRWVNPPKKSNGEKYKALPRFDDRKMVRSFYVWPNNEALQKLVDLLENPPRPTNYEPAFEDF